MESKRILDEGCPDLRRLLKSLPLGTHIQEYLYMLSEIEISAKAVSDDAEESAAQNNWNHFIDRLKNTNASDGTRIINQERWEKFFPPIYPFQ
jgi:hypothetical protein